MTDPRLLEELSLHLDPVWSWLFRPVSSSVFNLPAEAENKIWRT